MKREKGLSKYILLFTLFALMFSQEASAYYGRTGISPLDRGIEAISNVFNIRILRDNPVVQEGFFKFMLFIVLFAISNYGLNVVFNKDNKNPQGKKTAGVISFAFSMIGIFMMPKQWLDVTGGAITAIMSSFVFILIFYGGAYAAMSILKPKDENDEMGWVKHLLGFLLLLFLIVFLGLWADFARIPYNQTSGGSFIIQIYSLLISWTMIVLIILLVAKIVQSLGKFGLGGGGNTTTTTTTTPPPPGTPTPGAAGGPIPGQVQNLQGQMNVP